MLEDDVFAPKKPIHKNGIRGALARYADCALREQEEGAWERAVVETYRKDHSSVENDFK